MCLVVGIDGVEGVQEGWNRVRGPSQDRLGEQRDRRLSAGSRCRFAVGSRPDRSTSNVDNMICRC